MTIKELDEKLKTLRVLVIGDLMLDKYLFGKVTRISPEAPVPVVDVYQEEARLGGAANVALNLQALGVTPILMGCIGNDTNGKEFLQLLASHHLSNEQIWLSENRRTTTKFRIIGNNQQVLRVDKEDTFDITSQEVERASENVKLLLKNQEVHAIIFEDYDKGLITKDLIEKVVFLSNYFNIPTFVDPKFRNFHLYGNCTVFKPNLKELQAGLSSQFRWNNLEELIKKASEIRDYLGNNYLVVTLSDKGVLAVGNEVKHFPAYYRQIVDVSGAGDTVISVLCACMTAGLDFFTSCKLANLAGGLVCEKIGVVTINKKEWLQEAIQKKILKNF